MEKIKSQKGKELLLYEDYRYRVARINPDGSCSWRCITAKCRGRIRVNGDDVKVVSKHDHAPQPEKVIAAKCLDKIKQRATQSLEKPRQLILTCTNGIPLEAAVHLPKYSSQQRTVERVRRQHHHPYPNPLSVAGKIILMGKACPFCFLIIITDNFK